MATGTMVRHHVTSIRPLAAMTLVTNVLLGAAQQHAVSPGFCGKTDAAHSSDCARDERGTFPVRPADTATWPTMARACMRQCRKCERCHYISFSREWSDCSWYSACDLAKLEQEPLGFATLAASVHVNMVDWSPVRSRDRTAQLGSSRENNHDSPWACKAPLFEWINASGLLAAHGGLQGQLHWLDVGGGKGSLGQLLGTPRLLGGAAARAIAYDCVDPVESPACPRFDGSTLTHAPASRDVVSFVFVLHHASGRTVSLLEHAKRVARRYVVVMEDLQGETQHQAKMQFGHEWQGQFRSDEEWRALFRLVGMRVVHHTPIAQTCAWGYHMPRALYVLAV